MQYMRVIAPQKIRNTINVYIHNIVSQYDNIIIFNLQLEFTFIYLIHNYLIFIDAFDSE